MAFDLLHHTERFARKYTLDQRLEVENYLNAQLDKVDVEYISTEEREFMMEKMLVMYSNPLKNKLRTILGGE